MEYAVNEGSDWRSEMDAWLKSSLSHQVFNPNVESKRFLLRKLPHVDVRKLKFDDTEKFTKVIRGVVDLDSKEIASRTDYVICYWDESAQRGAGTKGELTLARFFRKPVYCVTEMNAADIPGWVLGCTTASFPSFDQLKLFLLKQFKRGRTK